MTDEQGQVKETLETKNEASVQGETTTQEKTTEDKSLSQQDIENIVNTFSKRTCQNLQRIRYGQS